MCQRDDTISRRATLDAFTDALNDVGALDAEDINTVLQMLPSAQPERKRGKWKPYRCDMYECSECGYIYTELTDRHRCGANFCPHCGADMRGGQNG